MSLIINPYAFGSGVVTAVTWSPTDKNADIALSGGDLIATRSTGSGSWIAARGTASRTGGVWYYEVLMAGTTGNLMIGMGNASMLLNGFPGQGAGDWGYFSLNGNRFNANGGNPYGASYGNGDVIGVKYDTVAQQVTFYKNGTSQGAIATFTGAAMFPAIGFFDAAGTHTLTGRFKAADIAFLPSGASPWE